MTTRALTVKVIRFELIGFSLVILMLWLDEVLDLPHALFRAPATPVNYVESIVESLLVVILGAIIVSATTNLLTRVKHLEGAHLFCSYCKRLRVGESWVPIEEYVGEQTEASLSKGLCPDCAADRFGVFTERGVDPAADRQS